MKKYYKYLDVQIPVTISYRSNTNKRTIMVDSKIADIIEKLNNDLNFYTLNSCSGHLMYSTKYKAWTLSVFYIDIEYSEDDAKLQAFLNALPSEFRYLLQSYRGEPNLHATIRYNVDASSKDFKVRCKAFNKAHKKLRKYIKKFSDAYRTPTSFETNSPTCSRSEYRSI